MSEAATAAPAAGTGTTTAEPRASAHGSREFPCPSCGADLEFHIGAQQLECPFCGHRQALAVEGRPLDERDLASMLARLAERRTREGRSTGDDVREVDCPSCGATSRFTGSLTAGECAWCGAPLQAEGVHDAADRIPVDGVLPFLVDRPTARQRLSEWVASRWFAPTEFLRRGAQGRFEGVYSPYWTYDSLTFTRWEGQRGEHYYVTVGSGKNRRRERRTRWYPVAGEFQLFFDDVLVPASAGLPAARAIALEPWPLERCVPFDAELLSGFLARTYDIELDAGFDAARRRMDDAIHAEIRSRIGGDAQRVTRADTSHDAVTFKHLLLPVWLLTYRFKDTAYRVLVNAATGEVQGDRPWSWVKIGLAALGAAALALVAVVLLNLR